MGILKVFAERVNTKVKGADTREWIARFIHSGVFGDESGIAAIAFVAGCIDRVFRGVIFQFRATAIDTGDIAQFAFDIDIVAFDTISGAS